MTTINDVLNEVSNPEAKPIGFSVSRLTLITEDGEYQDGFWDATSYNGGRSHLSADGWISVHYMAGSHKGFALVEHEDRTITQYPIDIDD